MAAFRVLHVPPLHGPCLALSLNESKMCHICSSRKTFEMLDLAMDSPVEKKVLGWAGPGPEFLAR